MSKVFVRVTGGLGNQLFQYVMAYKLQSVTGKSICFVTKFQNDFLRSKSLAESDFRDFSLAKLGLVNEISTQVIDSPNFMCYLIFKFRLAKLLTSDGCLYLFGNIYVDGYFIKDAEFSDEISKIREKISTKFIEKTSNEAAIHIRAGDLLRQPQNLLTTREYYLSGIDYFHNVYNVNKFTIVTEDVEFAKNLLGDGLDSYECDFQQASEIEDFITLCSHQFLIAANSTFSWIAGLLGLPAKFVTTEYFYTPGDKPRPMNREVILRFDGTYAKGQLDSQASLGKVGDQANI